MDLQPFEPIRRISENLYVVDGDWYGTPFRRRMTVIRLKSGGLFIHNAVAMDDVGYAALDALGPVEIIVAPNSFHGSDAPVYKQRYAGAKLYLPGGLPLAHAEVQSLFVEGMRMVNETVFFHAASRTLITTDLVFNMQTDPVGVERMIFKWNRIYKRFGPSRVFRYALTRDVKRVAESIRQILKWDFDRVVMNHGTILETGGKPLLKQSFIEIGIPV